MIAKATFRKEGLKDQNLDKILNDLKIFKASAKEAVEKKGGDLHFLVHVPFHQAKKVEDHLKSQNCDIHSVTQSEVGGIILKYIINKDSYIFPI